MSTITKRALAEALKKNDGKEASFQNHCDRPCRSLWD